jgi:hypothetical protein
MRMRGKLLLRERDRFDSYLLAERIVASAPLPVADRHPAAQIRERESALTVAAIGGADGVIKLRVFGDGKQAPVAKGPPVRGEISGKQDDLADNRLRHDPPSDGEQRPGRPAKCNSENAGAPAGLDEGALTIAQPGRQRFHIPLRLERAVKECCRSNSVEVAL